MSEIYVEILRVADLGDETIGVLYVIEDNKIIFECCTLELPFKDNQRNISCILAGKYKAVIHYSPKFGKCIWLQDVLNRSEILIHQANYVRQLRGCIAVGDSFFDLDADGLEDVTNSIKTKNKLLELLPNSFDVIIKYLPN